MAPTAADVLVDALQDWGSTQASSRLCADDRQEAPVASYAGCGANAKKSSACDIRRLHDFSPDATGHRIRLLT
jgi:hypothetical protein